MLADRDELAMHNEYALLSTTRHLFGRHVRQWSFFLLCWAVKIKHRDKIKSIPCQPRIQWESEYWAEWHCVECSTEQLYLQTIAKWKYVAWICVVTPILFRYLCTLPNSSLCLAWLHPLTRPLPQLLCAALLGFGKSDHFSFLRDAFKCLHSISSNNFMCYKIWILWLNDCWPFVLWKCLSLVCTNQCGIYGCMSQMLVLITSRPTCSLQITLATLLVCKREVLGDLLRLPWHYHTLL